MNRRLLVVAMLIAVAVLLAIVLPVSAGAENACHGKNVPGIFGAPNPAVRATFDTNLIAWAQGMLFSLETNPPPWLTPEQVAALQAELQKMVPPPDVSLLPDYTSDTIYVVKKNGNLILITYDEGMPEVHVGIYEALQPFDLEGWAPEAGFSCRAVPGSDELSDDEITGIVSVPANKP